jgi:hypothetical protein
MTAARIRASAHSALAFRVSEGEAGVSRAGRMDTPFGRASWAGTVDRT